jgi:signal transduction histidine kinase
VTALNFDLAWLLKQVDAKPIRDRIGLMIEAVTGTIHSIQRLTAELRPSALDDLGLIAAIEWQLSEFHRRTDIRPKSGTVLDVFVPLPRTTKRKNRARK